MICPRDSYLSEKAATSRAAWGRPGRSPGQLPRPHIQDKSWKPGTHWWPSRRECVVMPGPGSARSADRAPLPAARGRLGPPLRRVRRHRRHGAAHSLMTATIAVHAPAGLPASSALTRGLAHLRDDLHHIVGRDSRLGRERTGLRGTSSGVSSPASCSAGAARRPRATGRTGRRAPWRAASVLSGTPGREWWPRRQRSGARRRRLFARPPSTRGRGGAVQRGVGQL